MHWRALGAGLALLLVTSGCKSKPAPIGTNATTSASAPATAASASASAATAEPPPSVHATLVDASAPALGDGGAAKSVAREVKVSSRADDAAASPLAMFDRDDATSWAPAADDAAPTVSFAIDRAKTNVHALLVSATGVAEVKVTWTPRADETNASGVTYVKYGAEQTLAERVALDPQAVGLQRVAIEATERGILSITLRRAASGSIAVRELRLESDDDAAVLRPTSMVVAGGKPRGLSGIVPEAALELQCVAAVTDPPRAYCFGGAAASGAAGGKGVAFVMIDAAGPHVLKSLTLDWALDVRDLPAPYLRYADWVAIEKTLRDANATTLEKRGAKVPAGAIEVPWSGSAPAFGATLRQRETSNLADDFAPDPGVRVRTGVVELQWPGASGFAVVMPDAGRRTMGTAAALVRPLGAAWLVERSGGTARTPGANGSETVTAAATTTFGDASLCDPATKKCTAPFMSDAVP